MKRHTFFLLLTVFVLALASCQSGDDGLSPPEIRYGEDVCDHCNMIINEPRYAAAYTTTDGDSRRFDDIGEMLLYAHERAEDVQAFWVHDYHSEEWLDAAGASYVYDPELVTPMGWGIAAFGTDGDARAYGEENGVMVLTFEGMREQIEHGELAPRGMARHNH